MVGKLFTANPRLQSIKLYFTGPVQLHQALVFLALGAFLREKTVSTLGPNQPNLHAYVAEILSESTRQNGLDVSSLITKESTVPLLGEMMRSPSNGRCLTSVNFNRSTSLTWYVSSKVWSTLVSQETPSFPSSAGVPRNAEDHCRASVTTRSSVLLS